MYAYYVSSILNLHTRSDVAYAGNESARRGEVNAPFVEEGDVRVIKNPQVEIIQRKWSTVAHVGGSCSRQTRLRRLRDIHCPVSGVESKLTCGSDKGLDLLESNYINKKPCTRQNRTFMVHLSSVQNLRLLRAVCRDRGLSPRAGQEVAEGPTRQNGSSSW